MSISKQSLERLGSALLFVAILGACATVGYLISTTSAMTKPVEAEKITVGSCLMLHKQFSTYNG